MQIEKLLARIAHLRTSRSRRTPPAAEKDRVQRICRELRVPPRNHSVGRETVTMPTEASAVRHAAPSTT